MQKTESINAGSSDDALWFSVMQNSRRRYMIEHLRSNNGSLTLDVIIDHLIEIEKNLSIAKNLRRSIKISIVQTHIPMLERTGIVTFNNHTNEVRLIRIPDDVNVHMNLLHRADISYETYYIVISLIGIAGTIVSQWFAITALIGICFGAIVQKKGMLMFKGRKLPYKGENNAENS